MTEERLEEIAARAAAATPGTWYEPDERDGDLYALTDEAMDPRPYLNQPIAHMSELDPKWQADIAFIAGARAYVPELLAEVDRLRGEVKALRALARGVAALEVPPYGVGMLGEWGYRDDDVDPLVEEARRLFKARPDDS